MNLTFTYQTINIPNAQGITAELLAWVDARGSLFERYPQPFHHVPVKDIVDNCRLFYSWCLSQRIMPSIAAIMRLPPQPVGSPHRDWTDRNLALNFGLRIPQGSYTAIYDSDQPGERETLPSGGDRISFRLEDCREIARFDLSQPTIFNVQRAHAVVNPTEEERLSITFRFYREPWHLLEQQGM